jgi:hypothetical protein
MLSRTKLEIIGLKNGYEILGNRPPYYLVDSKTNTRLKNQATGQEEFTLKEIQDFFTQQQLVENKRPVRR